MLFHIETKRLLLRDLRITDIEAMFELDANPEVHRYLGNKPITTKIAAKKILKVFSSNTKNVALADLRLLKKLRVIL